MCECCDNINFLKSIYDKRFKFYATITTVSKGGTGTHSKYKLRFCPLCGRKLGD